MVVRQTRQTVQWRKQTSDDAGKTFSGVPSCDCCASLFFLAFAFSVFCCVRFSFQFIPPFFFFFVPDTEWIKLFLSQTFFLSFFLSFFLFLPSFLPSYLSLTSSTYSCKCRGLLLHLIPLKDTLDRTPLDEGSACPRDLYLTTHNTQDRQTSMPPAGFETAIPASERPQTHALDRAATEICHRFCFLYATNFRHEDGNSFSAQSKVMWYVWNSGAMCAMCRTL